MSNIKKSPTVKGNTIERKNIKKMFNRLYEAQIDYMSHKSRHDYEKDNGYWLVRERLTSIEAVVCYDLGLWDEYLKYKKNREKKLININS